MESDLQQHHHIFQQQHNQQRMNSGLARYRSAPSSYFQEQIDRELCAQFFKRPSSPETERIFAKFMSSGSGEEGILDQALPGFPENSGITDVTKTEDDHYMVQMTQGTETLQQKQTNYASSSSNIYQNPSQPPLLEPSSSTKFKGTGSAGMNQLPPMRTGGSNSSLIRHSSSPAGLFADIDIETGTGYAGMSSMGTFSSTSRIKSEANFSSGKPPPAPPPSSSGLISPVSEIENKAMKMASEESNYIPSFPISSWENPPVMPENLAGLKRTRTGDGNTFSSLNTPEDQIVDSGSRRPPPLAHHLSLPSSFQDMTAIFQDSVPCKIRAKRGCATHPRSIAERVRRTRISERMRKLQELVPNMDKQTNTAEMLDLAVDYIKDLQMQVKVLEEKRARCTCANKQQQ